MATRLHWRKHYCGDFLGRVALWPRAAVGTYAIMLDTMFLNGPMSDEELDATLSTNTPAEAQLIRRLLTRVEGGWIHHLVMESRERSLATSRNNIRQPRERAANASRSQSVTVLGGVSDSDSSRKGVQGEGVTPEWLARVRQYADFATLTERGVEAQRVVCARMLVAGGLTEALAARLWPFLMSGWAKTGREPRSAVEGLLDGLDAKSVRSKRKLLEHRVSEILQGSQEVAA